MRFELPASCKELAYIPCEEGVFKVGASSLSWPSAPLVLRGAEGAAPNDLETHFLLWELWFASVASE